MPIKTPKLWSPTSPFLYDVQVTLRHIAYGLDSAALDYRWEDTKIETGQRYAADDAVWVEFSGGLISRWREYWDTETPKNHAALG